MARGLIQLEGSPEFIAAFMSAAIRGVHDRSRTKFTDAELQDYIDQAVKLALKRTAVITFNEEPAVNPR